MKEIYYLDTNIWMDFYENRKNKYQNLSEIAFRLLCKLLAIKSKIIISLMLIKELETFYSLEQINGLIKPFEKNLIKVNISKQQMQEAKDIAKKRNLPKGDALHAIITRDNKAIFVSRDKHFQKLKDFCIVVKPEEII